MSEDEKWDFLLELDERFLKGGVILPGWAVALVKDSDIAFVNGAYLACIITGLAAIETYLRAESDSRVRLIDLIKQSDLENDLKNNLQELRIYRNKWVHVSDPWDDAKLLESPQEQENLIQEKAKECVIALRRTIYSHPWV